MVVVGVAWVVVVGGMGEGQGGEARGIFVCRWEVMKVFRGCGSHCVPE